MQGFAREVWLTRWILVREWLIGGLKALAVIAFWALMIWVAMTAIQASGLFSPTVR